MISFIVPICVAIVMVFLLKASKQNAQKDKTGNLVLKLPKLYAVVGIVCSVFFSFIMVISRMQTPEKDFLFVTLGFLLFVIFGLWLAVYSITYTVLVSEEYLERRNILGKTRRLYFNEVKNISFNRTAFELKLSCSQVKMNVHLHLIGFHELLAKIETKTRFNRKNMGIPEHLLLDK